MPVTTLTAKRLFQSKNQSDSRFRGNDVVVAQSDSRFRGNDVLLGNALPPNQARQDGG